MVSHHQGSGTVQLLQGNSENCKAVCERSWLALAFIRLLTMRAFRFWFPMLFSILIMAGMIILATPLVPLEWRIDGSGWAVILPLS